MTGYVVPIVLPVFVVGTGLGLEYGGAVVAVKGALALVRFGGKVEAGGGAGVVW